LAEGYADRVLGHLAEHAPGLRDLVRAVDVITPAGLARYNVNAIDGDPYAGSAELDQNFRWRPMAGLLPYRTPVEGLFQIGASTHPGPGLGGGSGFTVAQQLLKGRLRTPRRM
jgi:phytoene dehydrogenase-like protein